MNEEREKRDSFSQSETSHSQDLRPESVKSEISELSGGIPPCQLTSSKHRSISDPCDWKPTLYDLDSSALRSVAKNIAHLLSGLCLSPKTVPPHNTTYDTKRATTLANPCDDITQVSYSSKFLFFDVSRPSINLK